jgi:hypothetical protein
MAKQKRSGSSGAGASSRALKSKGTKAWSRPYKAKKKPPVALVTTAAEKKKRLTDAAKTGSYPTSEGSVHRKKGEFQPDPGDKKWMAYKKKMAKEKP